MTSRKISFAQAINEALFIAMRKEKKVLCYGIGVDDPKRIFSTTEGLKEKYGKNRRRRPGNLRAERELRAHLRARLRVRSTSYHLPRRDIRMDIELSRASVGTQTDTSDPSG